MTNPENTVEYVAPEATCLYCGDVVSAQEFLCERCYEAESEARGELAELYG